MINREREKRVAIAYCRQFIKVANAGRSGYTLESIWDQFLQSESYLSIPPVTDPLRERIEVRIKELNIEKDMPDQLMYGHLMANIIELENILKPTP